MAPQQTRTQTRTAQPAQVDALNRQDKPIARREDVAPAPELPEPVARRGINEEQWRTLKNSVFPGALPDSILMAIDYCTARKLDVLKRPCHIVGMLVTEKRKRQQPDGNIIVDEKKVWRDVILPGIYEYRITAHRTGEYLGQSEVQWGPLTEFHGLKDVPEWCAITVYRWSEKLQQKVSYPAQVFFAEAVATKNDGSPNARWTRAPRQMLEKCTEAAALRRAFPDEIGGEPTEEEMDGHTRIVEVTPEKPRSTKPAVQQPRATNGAKAETKAASAATEGAPAATSEASGETAESGAPPADAPVNTETGEVLARPDQITHIRALLDKTGVPENETCEQFGVETLEQLAFDQVAGVVAWIDRVSKG